MYLMNLLNVLSGVRREDAQRHRIGLRREVIIPYYILKIYCL